MITPNRRMTMLTRLLVLLLIPAFAMAQDIPETTSVPAGILLKYRLELDLNDAQVAKLEVLAQSQATALSKATSLYLRAEADLIDASRGSDLGARRTALDKRAKLAIDGEIARLKAEKDSQALLTAKQIELLRSYASPTRLDETAQVAVWAPLVTPSPLVRGFAAADSGDVRVIPLPLHTQIYIGGKYLGSGRLAIRLPVGKYELVFHLAACKDRVVPIEVIKGPPIVVSPKELECGGHK